MSNGMSLRGLVVLAEATPIAEDAARASLPVTTALSALGIVALGIWVARRIAHPAPLRLLGTPPRSGTLDISHAALVTLAWLALTLLASLAPRPWSYLAMLGVQAAALVLALQVAKRTFRGGWKNGMGLHLRHWRHDVLRSIWAYLAVLPVCLGLLLLAVHLLPQEVPQEHELLKSMSELGWPWRILLAAIAIVGAPLWEEVLFRGLIQTAVRHVTGRPWLAILVASALFAGMHISQPQAPPALFALSVAIGYNYERTGRLLSPILIHAIFNAVFVVEQWLQLAS